MYIVHLLFKERTGCTADILACHSRKGSGVTDNIKYDCIPFSTGVTGDVHTDSLALYNGTLDGSCHYQFGNALH